MTERPKLALFSASLGFFTVILDTTLVNVALPAIGADLGGIGAGERVADLGWVLDSYLVVFAALLLSAGALSDRLGARRCYAIGMAAFALSSAACALAPSLAVLIGARALQGAAAALMLPASLALVRQTFADPGERTRAIAVWTAAGGVGLAGGPLVGGALTQAAGWESAFLVNLPVAAVCLLCLRGVGHSPRRPAPIDVAAQLAAVVSLGGLVLAVVEGGHDGFASAVPLAGLVAFLAGGAYFLLAQARSAHPMLPLDLFASGAVSTVLAAGFAINMAIYGTIFVLSLFFQDVLGRSPLEAGLLFLPLTGMTGIWNIVAGRITERSGPRGPLVIGPLIAAAGFASLAFLDADSSDPFILISLLPIGIGAGLAVPALLSAMLEAAPHDSSGSAAGALNAARQLGGAVGVAVFGVLIAGDFVDGLQESVLVATSLCLASAVGCRRALR